MNAAPLRVEVVLPGVLETDAGGERSVVVVAAEATVRGVLDALAASHPLVERRLRDEQGQVRRHVNLFVDGDDIRASGGQDTAVRDGATVLVLPSIAGG